jgi:hypothetical protein
MHVSYNEWSLDTAHCFLQLWIGIHRNLNWKEFLKSQFSTLTDLNPEFGRPWDILVILFVNVIFIMFQKKSFDQNYFWIFMHGFKSAILAIFQFWQSGTFKPVHEIQKFFWQGFFWSIMTMTFTKNIAIMSQGPQDLSQLK